jgi:hypothetical protein
MADMLERAREDLPFCHKTLERQRGFLVYVTHTYPSLVPYLKGIHLTLDSWRPWRDSDGWKAHDLVAAHLGVENPSALHASPPKMVHAVPRLLADLEGLQTLFQLPHPPEQVVRTSSVAVVFYGFGDASGSGFGSTITTSAGIHFRYGVWGDDLAGLSSNYRELFNLSEAAAEHINQLRFDQLQAMVTSVASEAAAGHLSSCEFYLFTDNAVAEAAFYKGTSSNPLLFDLVLRLKQLELTHSFSLQVIHVSGKRMQAQGTDGLSRGDLFTGVMRGEPLTHFIPLHQSAIT